MTVESEDGVASLGRELAALVRVTVDDAGRDDAGA
jgi:hypothetical protein